jgi:hypothetical protein
VHAGEPEEFLESLATLDVGSSQILKTGTYYPLPTTHYPLPTTHYPLPTVDDAGMRFSHSGVPVGGERAAGRARCIYCLTPWNSGCRLHSYMACTMSCKCMQPTHELCGVRGLLSGCCERVAGEHRTGVGAPRPADLPRSVHHEWIHTRVAVCHLSRPSTLVAHPELVA